MERLRRMTSPKFLISSTPLLDTQGQWYYSTSGWRAATRLTVRAFLERRRTERIFVVGARERVCLCGATALERVPNTGPSYEPAILALGRRGA